MDSDSTKTGGACLFWALILVGVWIVGFLTDWGGTEGDGGDPTPPSPYTVPSFSFAPYTGPLTVCRDGWVSHSTGRGTCSHHGGEA